MYAFAGAELAPVRACQVVLGAGSCVLLAQAGWRLFGKTVGIASGLLMAVYAPVVLADVSIEKSVFDLFFLCLLLWLVAGEAGASRAARCLGIGASIGAMVLTRENALVFASVLVPWLALRPDVEVRARWLRASLVVAGVALVLSPVALRNATVGGELHLTTSAFGLNFFIGNNPSADGTYSPVVPRRGDPRVEFQDAAALAERAEGRTLTPSEVSGWYLGRALDYIRTQPGDWLALMGRKAMLMANAVEVADTRDQYSHEDAAWLLGLSGRLLHFGVLVPVALLGVWWTFADRRRLLPFYLLLAAYAGTLLLFYVFARYRLPLVPLLLPFAGAALVQAPARLRVASVGALAPPVAAALGLAVLANWPLLDPDHMRSLTHYNLGNELVARGETDAAIERYRAAVGVHDGNAMANNNLGVMLASRGDLAGAQSHYESALRISPSYLDARFNLARTLHERGHPKDAVRHYERGLRDGGPRADIHHELGQAYETLGHTQAAIDAFERAVGAGAGLRRGARRPRPPARRVALAPVNPRRSGSTRRRRRRAARPGRSGSRQAPASARAAHRDHSSSPASGMLSTPASETRSIRSRGEAATTRARSSAASPAAGASSPPIGTPPSVTSSRMRGPLVA